MDLRRWPGADDLLDQLLARPAAQRAALLEERTAGQPELRGALAAILAEADATDGFLDPAGMPERPALQDFDPSADAESRTGEQAASFKPGERLDVYEVVGLAGRGGMGEVYRARDWRLGRDVALKVLPAAVAADPERIARFEREARMLASLNHPNVGIIYGIVEARGRRALVLEYVEGETLAERIARRPLPIHDLLAIARQIALALDTAHRRGIIHRDLKPANIKITPDGTVKVLDFGLARAMSKESGDAGALTSSWHVVPAALGTPGYMAPEQVLGQPVDARADLWAFGCLLYEMLTGSRVFGGAHAAEVMSAVIHRDPDLQKLPASTPDPLRRLLARLLVKDTARRLASMADVIVALDATTRRAARRRPRTAVAAALLASAAVGALVINGTVSRWWRGSPDPVRLAVPVPASDSLLLSGQQVAALSPDGRTVVYRAIRGGRTQLFARRLDSLESTPIDDTVHGSAPFFSPDGRWLGFDGDGGLKKVPLDGGPAVPICEAPGGANASWGRDVIVFAPATGTGGIVSRVSPEGGRPGPLTRLDAARGDRAHAFPHVLPGGDAALFTIVTSDSPLVAAVRFNSREVSVLLEGSQPQYVSGGYLVFVRGESLWAVPFDERTLMVAGDARPVVDRVDTTGGSTAHFAISAEGTLLYTPPREEARVRRVVWLDRAGTETALPVPPAGYSRAALSPDGTRAALAMAKEGDSDIWIANVETGAMTRLTDEPSNDTAPLWSLDGQSVVFRSDRDGGGLFRIATGGGEIVRLTTTRPGTLHTAHGWSGNDTLLFTEFRSYTEQIPAALTLAGRRVEYLVSGPAAHLRPQVSPDGQWLAYQSDESGRHEIYVRPFRLAPAGVRRLSIDGGTSPRWTKGGAELLFYDGRGVLSVSVIADDDDARFERPVRLFDYAPYSGRLGPDFDVTPDGSRLLVIQSADETPGTRPQLVVVQNWIQELRERLAR